MKWKKPLTRQGFLKLAKEHQHLLENVRPQVVEGIATAAAEGDRSENAEYIYGKKRLREIDKKLRQLTLLMKDCDVVDIEHLRSDRVDFGALVTLLDEAGEEKTWRIVGVGEADVEEKTISYKSPVARALMGKKVGDFVEINRPKGPMEYEITKIYYGL